MGYGMKYTKGGFPFKASPTKQKQNTTPHFLERKPNPMVKAQKRKSIYNEKEEQTIENMSNAKDNNFDGHMEMQINKSKNYKKHSDLEKNDDDRPHPKSSYPATPKGSKQRSDAEKALEKSEDEKGY
tara:strand:+ start:150 stop:530 length:381 start_codon:yes stop_codon:yes gene_type:complete